jgi:cell division protein FtsQ
MKFKRKHRRKIPLLQRLISWLKWLLLLAIIALIGWGILHYKPDELLKMQINWTIDEPNLVEQQTLEKQIKPLLNDAYQLDLREIKRELEQHPWVREAQVKRQFWDSIQIKITTHKVAAHWENINCQPIFKGKNCLGYLTELGKLITPKNLFYQQNDETQPFLPLLKSAYDLEKSQTLLADFHTYQTLLAKMKILSFSRSNIDKLTVKPNIHVVLGYNKQHQRLENFVKIYQQLKQKISRKKLGQARFDMRYPKGFTLKY